MTLAELVPSLRTTLNARLEPGIWPSTSRTTSAGDLRIGGVDVHELANRFGTPLQVLDSADIRSRCRAYHDALPGAEIIYAGKAFLCRGTARLVAQEGCSIDACSGGEVAVAAAAGVPGERILLHGTVKTDEDLKAAFAARVGRIVIDSVGEIDRIAAAAPRRQKVLLRVRPDIDARTHPGLTTATADSWFGIAAGEVLAAVGRILARPRLRLIGLHCHLGSQVCSISRYEAAATRMVEVLAAVRARYGLELPQLDLGGGHAVGYAEGERSTDPVSFGRAVRRAVSGACTAHGIVEPQLLVEPGRAIVARAGVTLYRVAAVERSGGRSTVLVDGGMSDNPRPALYGARYPVRLVGRATTADLEPMRVAGRHCESTDVLADAVRLPADLTAGDVLAMPVSGAYQASMASTYNQIPRVPVVAVSGGATLPLLRRDTPEDLLRRDIG
ncbi:diaminopimelate decarboxylase [Pseudonocardia sp. EC080610-09]|uniref:diaminopimelate decarboxylase n=1 Tax=unclassified Pseudonocardia TaxID=2619320 RepID=UPI0006CB24D1|nr:MULTISPECIES: diaminopimelate decarboxylase [unclassified Pseudonocardia]ALE72442.1 diaminopimelate decarboxylase [Pseudonocardia sp. EC080625-04]ALL75742.1 diaminopimelate decarboxylase [Pseudonocardia sp. EC080610-09]ALL82769.1 diaminopimelate decarboxylase [Pseudonocardia sp. EC080619-01]